VRYLLLVTLVACGPKPAVVMWTTTTASTTEHLELTSGGRGQYTTARDGVKDKDEPVALSTDQISELAELFRAQHACELTSDPAYTPVPDEGKTTLELAFPDQRCKVVLWDLEWQHGRAREIADTMRSMRPLRSQRPERKLDPRQSAQ